MNRYYLKAETAAANIDGFTSSKKSFCNIQQKDRKFSANLFASLKLFHMLKLKWSLGPVGFGITECRLSILACSCTRSDSLSMTEKAY